MKTFFGNSEFEQNLIYYTEALTLAKHFPDYEGGVEMLVSIIVLCLQEWFDGMYAEDGVPYLKIDGESCYGKWGMLIIMKMILLGRVRGKKYKLPDLIENLMLGITKEWEKFKILVLGCSLPRKVWILIWLLINLENDKLDSRIVASNYGGQEDGGGKWAICGWELHFWLGNYRNSAFAYKEKDRRIGSAFK